LHEVENTIPFDQDQLHAAYDPKYVTRFWRILVQVERLLQAYRTPFIGKSSPVLFWWGSFDLSESRYSGRRAPEREWPARWMALAAEQEYAGCCDNSKNKHATKHFAATAHPIIMSYERGEEWGWCYVDQGSFESLPAVMEQMGKVAPPTR
jgi:hypothetical protein